MTQDFAAFQRKLDGVVKELDGTAGRRRLERVAKKTENDITEAVTGDIGDTSMSGWRRGSPITITGRGVVQSNTEILMTPAKGAAGPMRVLQDGRNQGNAGGFAGPGVGRDGMTARTKSGAVRKVRARKAKRWNGTTAGKGTWADAVKLMESRVGKRVDDEVVDALGRHLGRG